MSLNYIWSFVVMRPTAEKVLEFYKKYEKENIRTTFTSFQTQRTEN